MELKEGMYVRTKYGIAKYVHKLVAKETIRYVIDKKIVYDNVEDWEDVLSSNEILKASYNIIDLIEVGDYVNGWRVNRVEKEEEGTLLTVGTITSFVLRSETEHYLTQDYNEADKMCKLKSIVTKEQFEAMKYVVK